MISLPFLLLALLATALGAAGFVLARTRPDDPRRLREALDAMPQGLAFYDPQDRLQAWNAEYEALSGATGVSLRVGMTFAEILRVKLASGTYPHLAGREDAWIAERLAARRAGATDLTQPTADGRWLRITSRPTAGGGTVVVMADITDLKETEAAIAEARDRAETHAARAEVAEAAAGMGHWRLDAHTRELTWSAQLYRVYGLDPDQPLDLKAVMSMTHPDDAAASAERLQTQLAEGGAHANMLTRILRADGQMRWLQVNSDVERGPDGEILAVIGAAMDVTAQKEAERALEASEERFRRLTTNAPDMITEFQLDGTMTYVSPASFELTGYTPDELIGLPHTALMEAEDAKKVLAMCTTVFRSKGQVAPWPVEFRARHKDGRALWFECKPMFSIDPHTGRFVCVNDVVRDITPRKELEASLRQARAEAESAAHVKSEFLANMSHELRTPLTSILGFTGLAAEQPGLPPLARTFIERVGEASRALLCTVNDILDFSKLEAGEVRFAPQPMSIARLGRSTLDLFTPQAGAKDLALTLDSDLDEALLLNLDPDRLRQVLLNLVSNAVKFTEAGGVTLRLAYGKKKQRLKVEVIDTGAGIAPDKQALLFQRFSQIDGALTRAARGGTGLGLAICKGLVEAMGGSIGVSSTPGEGSRFWFEIPAPLAVGQGAAEPAQASRPPACAGARVLVADDHPANRELAKLFLTSVGAEVWLAESGDAAVEAANEQPFDVIVMDLRMPGGRDGLAALHAIRRSGGPNDATPVIAFTADGDHHQGCELRSFGFFDLVPKPLEPAVLIGAVARAAVYDPQPQALELADAV